MATDCYQQLTLWELGQQQVTVDFDGGCLVTDAGLLSLRALDKKLGLVDQIGEGLMKQVLFVYPAPANVMR